MSSKVNNCENVKGVSKIRDLPKKRKKELAKKLITRRLSLVKRVQNSLLELSSSQESRTLEITAIAPDKSQITLKCTSPSTVALVVSPILIKYRVCRARLLLAGSRAEVDLSADVSLLLGEVLLIEDSPRQYSSIGDTDRKYRSIEKLLNSEEEYLECLCSAKELYVKPLSRKHSEFCQVIFQPLWILSRVSMAFCQRIEKVLENWNSHSFEPGEIFTSDFWTSYWIYLESYREARSILEDLKESQDPLFYFLKSQQAAAKHSPVSLLHLPIQRLAEYERYLGQEARNFLSIATAAAAAENENDNNTTSSGTTVLQRGQLEGDLHRIQELFPNDNLRLYEQDVLTSKPRNLVRKRNTVNVGRIPRVQSQKSQNLFSNGSAKKSLPRVFLHETPVQFTTGMQSQERHLFLFSDLLLIAKSRNGASFKLKQSVKISELWLAASHIEDVAESSKSPETSFVLGWPTTNVVATFMTAATRDLWWNKLTELVREEAHKEPPETNIQIVYHDNETNTEFCKTIMVNSEMTASGCVSLATRLLDLQGPFQLWARTSSEESPYPLIGHERPFAIKLSNLRHKLSLEEGFDLEHCNKSGHDTCHFILRPILKSPAKKTKSKITGLLRRSLSLSPSIFGVNLSRLDENGLPKPVLVMLQQLFAKGPFTQGIFRKSANVRIVRELRDQIESSGDTSCLENAPVVAVAALFKDFLRSLPDPLLTSHLFPLWMAALETANPIKTIKSILERLPKANYNLLSHLICVLHHIARRSKHNLMCASNLGVCCGPSLLWSSSPTVNQSRAIPALTEMLIRHCETLFGEGVVQLLGEEKSDSGAEESTDSLHCESLDSITTERAPTGNRRFSVYRCGAAGGLSLDSLDLTEPPRKDHMSLSRDSGLTLSDCQLFAPESPLGSEDSATNGSSSSNKEDQQSSPTQQQKQRQTIQRHKPLAPIRCNRIPWEQNTPPSSNSNFQRQDWLRHQLKRSTRRLEEQTNSKVSPRPLLEVYASPRALGDLYGELYRFRQAEAIPPEETWPDTPPPLPPRLRHLPPVHMNLEDRHRLAGRSRSLPPPPPYRPPPMPRLQRSLGFTRSVIDDESYV